MIHKLFFLLRARNIPVIVILVILQLSVSAQVIPYPDALDRAAIVQASIENLDSAGMIVGNGDINALIFSKENNLVMHLAKNDVWDARLITKDDPPLLNVNVKEHSWMGGGRPASWNNPYPTQTPPAVIMIQSAGQVKKTKIDLKLGVASVKTSLGESTVRALSQSNVFYIESDKEVSLQGFTQSFLPDAEKSHTEGLTIIKQHLPEDPDYKGMDVFTVLKSEGTRHAVAIVNTRESSNALTDAILLANKVLEQESKTIIKEHEQGWQQFWSKSGVQLDDSDLQNWWYRQLYYLRCLSRPGAYPIALQGGYNSKANWHGTWTMNYNAQQTFWAAFSTNHVELSEPFIDLVYDYIPRAQFYASTVFNCEGGVTPHNFWPFEPDPKECVSVNKRQLAYMPWSYGIGTAGHIAHILWMHYQYNHDKQYLKNKIYPVIKDYALFYASFMEKCKLDNGKVVFGPSVDPEHTAFGWDNSPYDIAWAQHTLKAAIQGANDLGVDQDLVKRWSESLIKLPYYPVSGEIIKVGDREDGYNIITPVVPLFPAEQVSWFSPQSEKDLFKRTINWIDSRYNHNNSVVMINVARARLSMTDDALNDTKKWFKGKEQPNGLFYWKAHGFYMSEQTAVSGLITEFLVQSNDNILRVFPAWPDDKEAEFSDLRARGGFLVSARKKRGKISNLKVESTIGGELKLVSPWSKIKVKKPDGSIVSLNPDSLGVVSLNTVKGQKFEFVQEP
ncbi:hypothetical protein N9164_02580 [Draconibacterium sp.]|nr:hypothetical protein [Draconibacterium sp.]